MLRKFWFWLVGGCEHKWEVVTRFDLSRTFYYDDDGPITRTTSEYHMKCTKCGALKKQEL